MIILIFYECAFSEFLKGAVKEFSLLSIACSIMAKLKSEIIMRRVMSLVGLFAANLAK